MWYEAVREWQDEWPGSTPHFEVCIIKDLAVRSGRQNAAGGITCCGGGPPTVVQLCALHPAWNRPQTMKMNVAQRQVRKGSRDGACGECGL